MNPVSVGTTEHLLVADCKKNRIDIVSFNGDWLGSYDTSAHVQVPREITAQRDFGWNNHQAGCFPRTIYHPTDAAPSDLK